MDWNNGRITHLAVQSKIGGNLRLRLNQMVTGRLLKKAFGTNPNPLYKINTVPAPIIKPSEKDLSVNLAQSSLYDVKTEQGKTYTLIGK
jgi:alpha-L-fucosidase 2